MHIALFGGSFDPPHFGHLLIADTLVAQKFADVVWFMPCADHPFQKKISAAEHRVLMLKKLSKHSICTYEINKKGTSYSIDTLEHFKKIFPFDTFSWVIGADQLTTFDQWHRYQNILHNFQVLVYPRMNFQLEPLYEGMTVLQGVESNDISSTSIRQLVEHNQSIDRFTNNDIISYISEKGLYKS